MARYARQRQLSVDELRMQLSQQLRSNAAFSSTVYQDQPIIMTGAQLKSFVPDAIREARTIARNQHPGCCTVADVFCAQARLLAGYEDDFEFTGEFSHYYPTYEDMSNEQLRGYFTWRTKVRSGVVEKTSLSFAYVYLYELMHLIGVESALEGYHAMHVFGESYRRFDVRFGRHLDSWLDDFVIYYGLDASLLKHTSFEKNDAAFGVLEHRNQHSAQELFDALVQLGSYPIIDSPFFMEHEAELKQLIVHAYLVAAKHHDEKLKNTLASKLSGRMATERIWPFQRAVFSNPLQIESAEYHISEYDTIYCRNGAWFRTRHAALEAPLQWVTQLLETCESILRDAYAYPNMLGRPIKTKYIVKAAQDMAAAMVATARTRKEREVHIDFGSLDHIRKAADITCEKLIVEEENNQWGRVPLVKNNQEGQSSLDAEGNLSQEPDFIPPAQATATPRVEQSSAPTENLQNTDAPRVAWNAAPAENQNEEPTLNENEQVLLKLLLNGGSVRDFEREHSCIASVLIESINEKLYDEFADICIDGCGDTPHIIEDYAKDLASLIS